MRKEYIIIIGVLALAAVGLYVGSKYYGGTIETPKPDPKAAEMMVRPDSPSLGPADAKVTIVEFLDPECETCAVFAPIVKKVARDSGENVRLVVRYAPFHKNARIAAIFTEAAGQQGKYWEMQDKLFAKQSEWGEVHGHGAPTGPPPDPREKFIKYAEELGLNIAQLRAAVDDPKLGAKVDRDLQDTRTLGVRSTPTIYVNGRKLSKLNEGELRGLIAEELKK